MLVLLGLDRRNQSAGPSRSSHLLLLAPYIIEFMWIWGFRFQLVAHTANSTNPTSRDPARSLAATRCVPGSSCVWSEKPNVRWSVPLSPGRTRPGRGE